MGPNPVGFALLDFSKKSYAHNSGYMHNDVDDEIHAQNVGCYVYMMEQQQHHVL